jgi:Fe-S-cluster containining protein
VLEDEELFIIQNLLHKDYDIRVPFVCFRCGKCCREVSVRPAPADVPIIADFLGISVEQLVSQYLGEIVKVEGGVIEFKRTKRWKPCPFLSPSSTCTIYAVRPYACRSFPVRTDAGDLGIGCSGYKQIYRVMSAIGCGIPYTCGSKSSGKRPEEQEWPRIWRKFMKAKPTKEMITAFAKLNDIPKEIWGL